jgi:hypothetical protein
MTRIDIEGRVCVRLDVTDEVADQLTQDDLTEMAMAAVGASEMHQVVQLIVKGKAQWENGVMADGCEIEAPVYIELDGCEEIGRDRPYGDGK